jgi:hypothetical protein
MLPTTSCLLRSQVLANWYVANVSLIVGGGGDTESEWRSQFRTWMLSYDNVVGIYYFFPCTGALFLPPDLILCVRDACCTGSSGVIFHSLVSIIPIVKGIRP